MHSIRWKNAMIVFTAKNGVAKAAVLPMRFLKITVSATSNCNRREKRRFQARESSAMAMM